jgi:hypothetical protein
VGRNVTSARLHPSVNLKEDAAEAIFGVWNRPETSGRRHEDVVVPLKLQREGASPRRTAAEAATDMAMSRSSSWKEHRLANRLVCDGNEYSVDLVARKATGVEGWKMTVIYLPRGNGSEVKIDLPNAASTADVRRVERELEGADERLVAMFRASRQ